MAIEQTEEVQMQQTKDSISLTEIARPTSTPAKPRAPLSEIIIKNDELNKFLHTDAYQTPIEGVDTELPDIEGLVDYYSGVYSTGLEEGVLNLGIILWRFDSPERCDKFDAEFKKQYENNIIKEESSDDTSYWIIKTDDFYEMYICVEDTRVGMLLQNNSIDQLSKEADGEPMGVFMLEPFAMLQAANILNDYYLN